MLPFRHAEIHGRCCDSSTDLEARATFECSVAIRHLEDNIKFSAFLISDGAIKKDLTL